MGAGERYAFGPFVIDADERQLARGSRSIALAPKTFELLLAMVRRAGRLVTKRELLELVWPEKFVEEGILSVHVSALRKVLDDGTDRSIIETVPRSGYRFRSEVKAPPASAAQEAFLKGIHSLNRMTRASMERARAFLQDAVVRDPSFGPAHSALASCYVLLAANGHEPAKEMMPLARVAVARALDIDRSMPEAHGVLADITELFDFDWAAAERHYRLAMACDPVPTRARFGFARHLLLTGRAAEGVHQARLALEQDPVDLLGRLFLAHCLQTSSDFVAAADEIRQVLELDETLWLAYLVRALNQTAQARYGDALISAERASDLAPWNLRAIGLFAGLLKRTGHHRQSEDVLRRVGAFESYGVPNALMLFHLACSERDEGSTWAEAAIDQRDPVAIIHLLGPDRHFWSAGRHWSALETRMRANFERS